MEVKFSTAPIVVVNVNAKATLLELVGKQNFDREFVEYVRKSKMLPLCFMVFQGIKDTIM